MAILDFLEEILSTPAILVGLLAMVGLIAAKSDFPDVVTGTLKTILGFLILGGGAGILIGALEPLGTLVEEGLGLQGVIPTNEAVVGLAQEDWGAQTAGIMGLAFVVNLILARITPLRYVFLTGHHVFFMSALAAVVMGAAGITGAPLIILGALLVGSLMVIMPALAMPYVRRITGGEDIAVGHFGTIGYIASAFVGDVAGDESKGSEDWDVPKNLKFFRDSLVSTATTMVVIYLAFTLIAGPSTLGDIADGNPWVFAFVQALTFAAGVWVILVGVRMILAEVVPAFEGISTRLIPDAVPALDIPIIFPYASTAVIIGFMSSVLGGLVSMLFLGPLGLALIIPGMVPHFFVGGGAGVFGNATGGRRGAAIGGFVNGIIISFLPALLLGYLGDLGVANTTFGDGDFAWVGIITGIFADLGIAMVVVWVAVLLAATFLLGRFFPTLTPHAEDLGDSEDVDEEIDLTDDSEQMSST